MVLLIFAIYKYCILIKPYSEQLSRVCIYMHYVSRYIYTYLGMKPLIIAIQSRPRYLLMYIVEDNKI